MPDAWSSDQSVRLRSPTDECEEGRYHPHTVCFTTAPFVYVMSIFVLSQLGFSHAFILLSSLCLSMLMKAENINIT